MVSEEQIINGVLCTRLVDNEHVKWTPWLPITDDAANAVKAIMSLTECNRERVLSLFCAHCHKPVPTYLCCPDED